MADSGSIRSVAFSGIPFDVAADADIGITPEILIEAVPHSGGNSFKLTFLNGEINGVTLIANSAQLKVIDSIIAGQVLADITIGITLADGSTYSAPGKINRDVWNSMENRVDIVMIPRGRTWNRFGL